jgi:hypothetical protein
MSISNRTVMMEAAGAAAFTAAAVAIASPSSLWLPSIGLHPGWLPVIVLAARYGTRGLFASLGFVAAALVVAGLVLGGDLDSALAGLTARERAGSDLLALACATVVAWIAMMHETRLARVAGQLADATEAQQAAETTVHALHDSLSYLRRRHDRLDVTLSMWRDAAARIERGDATEAAKAILELCEVRLGAGAGMVQVRDGNRLSTLTSRGAWIGTSSRPRDIAVDVTVREAIVARRVTPAGQGASETDSDVAAPIVDEDSGVVLGVIALRGVSAGSLKAADLSDLRVLAQWLAPALARPIHTTGSHRAVTAARDGRLQ